MRRRWSLWLGVVEAILLLLAIYFEPTCVVRGTLRGEAFFDGKPTSWWRRELERWEIEYVTVTRLDRNKKQIYFKMRRFHRQTTWIEDQADRWLPQAKPTKERGRLIHLDGAPEIVLWGGNNRDKGAAAVLRELIDDPSPMVRLFAGIGLGIRPLELQMDEVE